MDIGIYALNAARYMTGEEPIAVYAHEQTDRSDPRFHEVEDMIEFQLEFPSGVIGSCMSMYSANQRSEEHTSELQSLMRISYAAFCLKHKTHNHTNDEPRHTCIPLDVTTINNTSTLYTLTHQIKQ